MKPNTRDLEIPPPTGPRGHTHWPSCPRTETRGNKKLASDGAETGTREVLFQGGELAPFLPGPREGELRGGLCVRRGWGVDPVASG